MCHKKGLSLENRLKKIVNLFKSDFVLKFYIYVCVRNENKLLHSYCLQRR